MNVHQQHGTRLLAGLAAGLLLATACAPDQEAPPTPTKTPLTNGLIAADSPTPSPVPFVTETPTPTATLTPSATPIVSATPLPSETPQLAPSWTPPPTQPSRSPSHSWLSRPIPEGFTNFVDRNYPYGTTSGGEFRVHHGYEFNNPRGTPIVAPAAGTVVFAGDDRTTQFGPEKFFYGLLVVMQLDAVEPDSGEPLFLLFGHMDSIDVQQGEKVAADNVLGTVGNTGVALGAHLHFEVRAGDMFDYNATRNADLWLAPFLDFGTVAGRVVDGNDTPVYGVSITLQDQDGTSRYTWTYEDDNVNGDNALGENFTRGDLPKGYYRIVLNNPITGKKYEDLVYVEAHKTMWVEFVLDD